MANKTGKTMNSTEAALIPGITELTCIQCPIGCALKVEIAEDGTVSVTGNTCPRGEVYGKQEVVTPVRTITSTVPLEGGFIPRVPVRTASPVPKASIMQVMEAVHGLRVKAPVRIGDVLIRNVAGTGSDLIVTRDIEAVR